MSESNNKTWIILILLVVGIIWGVGPLKNAHCTRDKSNEESSSSTQTGSDPSFTGKGTYTKYKCSVNGCLCTKYQKKSTYNSDCENCGHHQDEHYEFR